jgi:hypothetical protein
MRRYALAAILGLNIDEDDDGNQASGNNNPVKQDSSKELPWLNKDTKEFSSVLAYLIDNGTMDKVRLKYKVSKEVETLLLSNLKK